jgi:hypothetical protein
MKKTIVGALVGAIIIFLWQFLSWTVTGLHRQGAQYTPKQDSILSYLSTQFSEDGAYMLPSFPDGTSMEDQKKMGEAATGKPWAQVYYHKVMKSDMGSNMGRGFLVNLVMVWLACWIFSKLNGPSFGTIFLSSVFIGLIVFLNSAYTMHIWFQTKDINAYLIDALVAWGVTGIWLGWWMKKKS